MQAEPCVMECLGDWEARYTDALDDLDPASCFPYDCFSDFTAKLPDRPCALFDVLGTEATWQGKHFHQIFINGRSRGMLNLVRWPMVQVFDKLSMPQLGLLARTCHSLRKAAQRAMEERAQELLVSRYFQESHLIKFIDAFACFGWAMSLTESLTPATVATWRAEELDAIFEHLVAFIQIEEVSLLHGLQPEAARRWKIEGRQTLELFVADCVTLKASFCKLLMHYDRAWLAIRKIMELNAKLVMAVLFKDSSAVMRQIKASWPTVTVEAEVEAPSKHGFDHDMSIWSPEEMYQWFRLKKLPVRGLLDLQPNGADLLDWIAKENNAGAQSRLSALPPHGLGMSSLQRSRLMFLVNRVGIAKPRKTHAEEFTFRFAERVDSHRDTEDRADWAVAAPPAGSTPCRSSSSV
jgi:hypothetical protein